MMNTDGIDVAIHIDECTVSKKMLCVKSKIFLNHKSERLFPLSATSHIPHGRVDKNLHGVVDVKCWMIWNEKLEVGTREDDVLDFTLGKLFHDREESLAVCVLMRPVHIPCTRVDKSPNYATVSMEEPMNECLFCAFARGEQPHHRIWEDDAHIAFLTIFPNTPGATVVIPRVHFASNALALPEDTLLGLVLAAKRVAAVIDRAFPDVGRTALVFEGFGIDHVHAKLFPLHGTRQEEWWPIVATEHSFTEGYCGFVTTHDGPLVPDEELAKLAEHIRNA